MKNVKHAPCTETLDHRKATRFLWATCLTTSTLIRGYSSFAEKGPDNYLVMCDMMSGFFQVFKVRNKSASEAILKVQEWSAFWGKPFQILTDSGPGFRQTFEEEANKLGITVIHSSGYNSSSQSHVERCVGQLKTLLKKCGPLSQLQLHEMVYTINCREQNSGMGSAIARFLVIAEEDLQIH